MPCKSVKTENCNQPTFWDCKGLGRHSEHMFRPKPVPLS